MNNKPPRETAGIKAIAEALGVSLGTVDRALNGRPGISAATKERVLEAARKLGYRRNLVASSLRSGRKFRVVVNLPHEISWFFDAIRVGIRDAADLLGPAVETHEETFTRFGERELESFERAAALKPDAIIVAPGNPDTMRPAFQRARQCDIAVVCVGTAAPETESLTTVTADSPASGAMAAEILSMRCGERGKILVVTGMLSAIDHLEKLRGFRRFLDQQGPDSEIAAVIEAHDDERQASEKTYAFAAANRDLSGVYVSTAISIPVLAALREAGVLETTTVVTTDIFPAIEEAIRKGEVAATIYQRPVRQGRLALETIASHLMTGVEPPPQIRLMPYLLMRSNLDAFKANEKMRQRSFRTRTPLRRLL